MNMERLCWSFFALCMVLTVSVGCKNAAPNATRYKQELSVGQSIVQEGDAPSPEKGAQLFNETCSSCHNESNPIERPLTPKKIQESAALASHGAKCKKIMEPTDSATSLCKYLTANANVAAAPGSEAASGGQAAPAGDASQATAEKGQQLFATNCAKSGCHAAAGATGIPIARPLTPKIIQDASSKQSHAACSMIMSGIEQSTSLCKYLTANPDVAK